MSDNKVIVCVSMGLDHIIDWVHIITWSESEILRLNVRDYLLDLKEIKEGDSTHVIILFFYKRAIFKAGTFQVIPPYKWHNY